MVASVIQSQGASGTGASLSFSLGGATSGGYAVLQVMAIGTVASAATISATLGGVSMTVKKSLLSGGNGSAATLEIPAAASGQTAVAITTTGMSGSGQGVLAYFYELGGLGSSSAFDAGAISSPNGTTWTSGNTVTTAQPDEIWIGMAESLQSGAAVGQTGPASPWVNLAVQQQTLGSFSSGAISGYSIVSSTGLAAYAGTPSRSAFSVAMVATFKAAAAPPPTSGSLLMASGIV